MTQNYWDTVDAIVEHLDYVKPEDELSAVDAAREALHESIDSALIYTSDVLKLWDGSTHEDVSLADYEDIMDAITASTYCQLSEDWDDAVYDGIDKHIDKHLTESQREAREDGDINRDDALAIINGNN